MRNDAARDMELRLALERIRQLEMEVGRDSLTGLYNRACMEKIVNEWLKEEGRSQHVSFLMIDLDDFKLVNDCYGHLTGDEVLKAFADLLREIFPKEHMIGRLGGDEFAVMMTKKEELKCAKKMSDELIFQFEKLVAEKPGLSTVSCTVGICRQGPGVVSFESLYKAADDDLYEQKRKKKGQ